MQYCTVRTLWVDCAIERLASVSDKRRHSARHTVMVVEVVVVDVVIPAAAGVICKQLQAEDICDAAYFDSAAGVVGLGVGFAPLLLFPPAFTVLGLV